MTGLSKPWRCFQISTWSVPAAVETKWSCPASSRLQSPWWSSLKEWVRYTRSGFLWVCGILAWHPNSFSTFELWTYRLVGRGLKNKICLIWVCVDTVFHNFSRKSRLECVWALHLSSWWVEASITASTSGTWKPNACTAHSRSVLIKT